MGEADQDRAAAGAHGLPARSRDGSLQANKRDRLLGFFGLGPDAGALERVDPRPLAHRERQPLRARHDLRRGRSRIRKNPDIVARLRSFAYNLLRAEEATNIKNARWRAALDINSSSKCPDCIEN